MATELEQAVYDLTDTTQKNLCLKELFELYKAIANEPALDDWSVCKHCGVDFGNVAVKKQKDLPHHLENCLWKRAYKYVADNEDDYKENTNAGTH